jgi:hypothetical protein
MPGFDGTGPGGMGPMTGGARGWCNSYSQVRAGYVPSAYRTYSVWGAGYAPVAGRPAWGYGLARPRWGLRGFWGRGRGRGQKRAARW